MRVHTGEDVWNVMQSRENEGNDGVETDFREKNRHRCIGPCDRCSAAWPVSYTHLADPEKTDSTLP